MASDRKSQLVHDVPRSLWEATASPARSFPALARDASCDVAIIGAGYSGLSAAARLAELGEDCVLLEANRIGWGASGRNGGVVSSKFRPSFLKMAQVHGLDCARQMYALGKEAVDSLQGLIERFQIAEAGFCREGMLRCAHNRRAFEKVSAEAEWQRRELGDRTTRILSAEEVAEETGSRAFFGGVLTADAGMLHPLNYARGLARALSEQMGVSLHEGTPALQVRREGGRLVIETPGGCVRARRLLLASNSYSQFSPVSDRIRRAVVPFRSAIIATEPLNEELAGSLLVKGRSYGETRRMMRWFRKAEGRFLFGGRGAFGKEDSAAAFQALHRGMVSLFPQLRHVPLAFKWSGHVAMTLDQLPHAGALDKEIFLAAGYNGSGVAMSGLLGRKVAEMMVGKQPDLGLMSIAGFRPVPFYPVREVGIRLVAAWYGFLDRIGR